jgi:hypothetical protein
MARDYAVFAADVSLVDNELTMKTGIYDSTNTVRLNFSHIA